MIELAFTFCSTHAECIKSVADILVAPSYLTELRSTVRRYFCYFRSATHGDLLVPRMRTVRPIAYG